MKTPPDHDPNEIPENDPVWKLLGSARDVQAGPRFAERCIRRARLEPAALPASWWARWFASPVPVAALAGAAAAIAVGWFALSGGLLNPSSGSPHGDAPVIVADASNAEPLEHIQEVLESELLLVAVDNLDEFSDAELLVLIGF